MGPNDTKLKSALRALEALNLRDLQHVDAGVVGAAAAQIRAAITAAYARPGSNRQLSSLSTAEKQPTVLERQLMQELRKINAIKSVRDRTGLGLADAKNLVESWNV